MTDYCKIYKGRIKKFIELSSNTPRELEMLEYIKSQIDYNEEPPSLITVVSRSIPVQEMLNEVNIRPGLWRVYTNRQRNIKVQRETESISLVKGIPIPRMSGSESLWDSHEYIETVLYNYYPNIKKYLESFPEKVARVSLIRLNGQVYKHIDYGAYYRNRKRYHLCLEGEYDYHVLDQKETICAGTLFHFNNDYPHWAINKGKVPRISIVFDTE